MNGLEQILSVLRGVSVDDVTDDSVIIQYEDKRYQITLLGYENESFERDTTEKVYTKNDYKLPPQVDPSILDGCDKLEEGIIIGIANSEHDGIPYCTRFDIDTEDDMGDEIPKNWESNQYSSIFYKSLKKIEPELYDNILKYYPNLCDALLRGISFTEIKSDPYVGYQSIRGEFKEVAYDLIDRFIRDGTLNVTCINDDDNRCDILPGARLTIGLEYLTIKGTYLERESFADKLG